MEKKLIIKDLTYSVGNKKIFSQLNLSLSLSKTYLWKGTSGVGKSTLARIICGHVKAQSGIVALNNNEVIAPQKKLIYLSQQNDLFGWQSTKEHINFLSRNQLCANLQPHELQEYIDVLELKDLMSSYPAQLSAGQAKRVQILRALVLLPEIMILDETLSALDLNLKNKVLNYLKSYWQKNQCMGIIISHELDQSEYSEIDLKLDFNSLAIT